MKELVLTKNQKILLKTSMLQACKEDCQQKLHQINLFKDNNSLWWCKANSKFIHKWIHNKCNKWWCNNNPISPLLNFHRWALTIQCNSRTFLKLRLIILSYNNSNNNRCYFSRCKWCRCKRNNLMHNLQINRGCIRRICSSNKCRCNKRCKIRLRFL